MFKFIGRFGLALGLILLILNIQGLLIDPYGKYKYEKNLNNIESLYTQLDSDYKKFGRSENFLQAVANISNLMMKYELPEEYEYMPMSENWILFSMRIWDPFFSKYILSNPDTLIFRNIELPVYKYAFNRGRGMCSQQAMAFSDLLWTRYGFDARVAGLNGHVVVQVLNLEKNNYIFDPSFHALTIGNVNQPELIDLSYLNKLEFVKRFYTTKNDNYVSSSPGWGPYSERQSVKQYILFYFTIYSYWFKWLIPIALFIYGLYREKITVTPFKL
jgi:hypothetical protein